MICSKRDFELELIQRIRSNQATLIDFRNYIFSRKARLLTHLNRSDDLAKSALDYVKIGFTEMKNHININENGLRLWALLASMEANNVLECMKENTDSARQSLLLQNSALLLDMARQHLSGGCYILTNIFLAVGDKGPFLSSKMQKCHQNLLAVVYSGVHFLVRFRFSHVTHMFAVLILVHPNHYLSVIDHVIDGVRNSNFEFRF